MIELTGDLWDYHHRGYVCITTNGLVKSNGECVMGRGVALQATQRFPRLALRVGGLIREHGNHVHVLPDLKLITLPVKHHWKEPADLELIKRSINELESWWFHANERSYIHLPRPGCGNGRLQWSDVKPLLVGLSDQFIVVHKP